MVLTTQQVPVLRLQVTQDLLMYKLMPQIYQNNIYKK